MWQTVKQRIVFGLCRKKLSNQSTISTGTLGLGQDLILDFISTPSFSNWHWEFLELTHQPLERKDTIPIKFFVNILNIWAQFQFFFWSVSHIIIWYSVIYSKSPQESFENLLRLLKSRAPLIILIITIGSITMLIAYLIFVIFFTRAKFLENKIYTEKRQFFALNM